MDAKAIEALPRSLDELVPSARKIDARMFDRPAAASPEATPIAAEAIAAVTDCPNNNDAVATPTAPVAELE